MRKSGWQGASNAFIKPMEQSIENAGNIVIFHLSRLDTHKTEGTWQLAMFNDFKVPANSFLTLTGQQAGDKQAQVVLTEDFESEFKDMHTKLDEFDSLVRIVLPVNSTGYNLIFGRNRDRFYQGSYQMRIDSLAGMATEMTAQTVPDAATATLAYRDEIIGKRATQSTRMTKVGTDGTSVDTLRQTLIKKLNKNLGGLKFNFGDEDNCQEIVNKYFPLNILGDRSVKGHYQLIVPKSDFRKVAIHLFKEGEMVELEIGDADVWISMADNANSPVPSGFRAIAHSVVTVNPVMFGDLTKKYIIATNVNLTISTDLIFNIIKP